MADWIWNSSTERGFNELTIDILNENIEPNALNIKPIKIYLPELKKFIAEYLTNNNLDANEITDAKFYIKLFEKENRLRCVAVLTDYNKKKIMGTEHFEHPYDNNFKVFKARKENDMDWANEADHQLNTSEWIGAIIRYFLSFGRKKFNTFYNRKELKRNALTGYFFQVSILILILYLGYKYGVG